MPQPDSQPSVPGEAGAVPFGDELVRTVKLITALRHRVPRQHPEVDPLVYPLLFNLVSGPQRVGDLADLLHLDISTVSRQVAHLAGLGLIARQPDPTDRRAQLLTLTDDGVAMLESLRRTRDAGLRDLVADWTEEEQETLADLLARLNDAIEHAWPERPST
jgi:DNA-binding MarR family transcriptional regulator